MPDSSAHDADSRLLRARIGLALRQPFLSGALMRLPIRSAPSMSWCPTIATDGFWIFYNPDWTGRLGDAQLRGVLAHELMHVLFAHSARRGGRDGKLWNAACDYAINLLLLEQGFRLPTGGLIDREYVGLAAEEIYLRLERGTSRARRGQGAATVRTDEGDVPGELVDPGGDILDVNDPRVAAARGRDAPDAEQRAEIVTELRDEAAAKLQGRAAAWFRNECYAADDAKIDWRALLRQWLHARIKSDWSIWPPAKKHLYRGLYLPSMGIEAPGHLVFAIDTSGSMSEEELGGIFAEVRAYREMFPARLTVVQADAAIQRIDEFGEMDGMEFPHKVEVLGRGGTDFRPVFDWFEKSVAGEAAALLFATDGYGTFPKRAPGWPVIWLRTRMGAEALRFPFGEVVTL